MFDKLKAFYAVFQAGKTVADKQAWRTHQVSANAIAAFLFAIVTLAKSFGYDLGIDMQTCADIAVGVLAITNVGLTVATSHHLGVKPSMPATPVREAESPVPSDERATERHAEVATDEAMPSVSVSDVQPTSIDDDTRARAIAWAREHSTAKPSINNSNGLQNDA